MKFITKIWAENKGFIILLITIVITRLFFFDISVIKGQSMLPTFQGGEYILVNKISVHNKNNIKNNDIVIIKDTNSNKNIIKRVIGIEGDTIKIDNGKIYVNGKLEKTLLNDFLYGINKEFIIDKGHLFYLGDNVLNSSDSRFLLFNNKYKNGTISINNVIGFYSITLF